MSHAPISVLLSISKLRPYMQAQKSLSTTWYSEEESRVPYTPYFPTHYLYVGEKKGK